MAKPRVHELAKEFGVTSKEVIAKLGEMNEFVKGPSSTLNPMVVKKLREAFPAAKPAAEAAQKPAASQKAASGASAAPKSAAKPAAPKPGPKSAAQKQSGTKAAPSAGKAAAAPKPAAPKPGPKPGPRPGNNPFSSQQGMKRPERGEQRSGGPRPPRGGQRGAGSGGPRPAAGSRPGGGPRSGSGGGSRPTPSMMPKVSNVGPGSPSGGGNSGGGGGSRRGGGGFNRGPGRPGPGGRGNAQGAFGRGGSKRKNRKSKAARRSEQEQLNAPAPGGVVVPRGDGSTEIRMRRGASIMDFAEKIGANPAALITVLFHLGEMATQTQSLDEDTFELLGAELGYVIKIVSPEDEERELLESFDIDLEAEAAAEGDKELEMRPPVVTVMGHVDHGKTRLLDAIRNTNVIEGEAGGITQHIGAYQVHTTVEGEDRAITFIDTPGHEAFTAMRARGAKVTDVAILVVAADDGVMPQTVEALNHAQAANVPIVVAVNKIDKEGASPDKVKGRGAVSTVLVQSGTLHVGDAIVAGVAHGRVRAMFDENGQAVKEAGPSRPVQVLGLSTVPRAGDTFLSTEEERTARQIAEKREAADRNAQLAKRRKRVTLESFDAAVAEGKMDTLNLIIKGDVSGAVEAIEESLMTIDVGGDEVQLRVIHRGVGAITQNDVNLATVDNAVIIGFNVRPAERVSELADREGVEMKFYSVIYRAIEEIEQAVKGMLKPEYEEVELGSAEIREVFRSSKWGNIAGSLVKNGIIKRNSKARLVRDGSVVAEDLTIESLRRFKDDATEVREGYECGIGLGSFNDIKEGDVIETWEMREKKRV